MGSSTGPDLLTVPDLQPGDLVVTEWMPNPTCSGDGCEWVELYNASGLPIDLMGLRVADADTMAVPGEVLVQTIVEAGDYVVLSKTNDSWPYDVPLDGTYGSGVTFNNDGSVERVRLLNGGPSEIDRTAGLGITATFDGASVSLDPNALDALSNDEVEVWCAATSELTSASGMAEWGTPGAPNDPC